MNAVTPNTKPVKRPYRNAYMDQVDDPIPEEEALKARLAEEATPKEPTAQQDPTNPEEITFKDRYSNLRRFHENKMREAQEKINELNAKVNENNRQLALPKTAEEVEAWRKQYPEIYDLVRTVARTEAQDERSKIDKDIEELKQSKRELAKDRALAQVLKAHPDFNNLRANEDFHMWASQQNSQVQAWLYENEDNAELAIRAVDLYKLDRGYSKKKAEDKKKEDAKASQMVTPSSNPDPTGQNKKVWKMSDIKRLTPKQYEKLEDEIDQARAEGRIDYDIM